MAIITVVHTRLDVDIADDESNTTTHGCSQKVAQLLCKCDSFLLTYYDHDIVFDNILRRYRTEYSKQES